MPSPCGNVNKNDVSKSGGSVPLSGDDCRQKPIVYSDTAFVIRSRTLHIDAIAPVETDGVFYFGSIHKQKILKRDLNGIVTDFTSSAQDGLAAVFSAKAEIHFFNEISTLRASTVTLV